MHPTRPDRRSFLRALALAGAGAPLLARAEALEATVADRLDRLDYRPEDPMAARALADQYALADDLVYLNHASIGTVPRPVLEAHAGYLEMCERHPSLYVWGAPWREVTEQTRADAARLLGADADDLAITHNTTEGFNVLAHGLPLEPGDEVLLSTLNHAAASVPWERMAGRRGFSVRRFEFPLGRVPEMSAGEVVDLHLGALGPRTRALVVPHVDNMVGIRHPLPDLARAVRERGVRWVLVDGAQSAGAIPLELRATGVDAYAMSPHKWLQAPKGLGLFWVGPELRERLPPMWHRSGGAGRGPSARQYEDYSTRAWPAVVALGDALRFQAALGAEATERGHRANRRRLLERVDDDPALSWRSPRTWELGGTLVAVGVRGREGPELARALLRDHGIDVRGFGGGLDALRVSPNLATGVEALDRALDRMAAAAR